MDISLLRLLKIFGTDPTKFVDVNNANTSRNTSTVVAAVQNIDATGKVSPAGDTLANAPYNKTTNYNSAGTELFTNTNPAIVGFEQSNESAFGVLQVAEETPVFQGDFVSGLNTQMWRYVYVFTVTSPGSPPAYGDIKEKNYHPLFFQFQMELW